MGSNGENVFERLWIHRVRIGKWHMAIGEWLGLLAIAILGPFMAAAFFSMWIAAFFENENRGFEEVFFNVYWWVYGVAVILYFFFFLDTGRWNTDSTQESIRREEIRSGAAYKFKMRHIESLKGYLGDYYAENLEKDIFKEKQ